jgi:hypothetical protein
VSEQVTDTITPEFVDDFDDLVVTVMSSEPQTRGRAASSCCSSSSCCCCHSVF